MIWRRFQYKFKARNYNYIINNRKISLIIIVIIVIADTKKELPLLDSLINQ